LLVPEPIELRVAQSIKKLKKFLDKKGMRLVGEYVIMNASNKIENSLFTDRKVKTRLEL